MKEAQELYRIICERKTKPKIPEGRTDGFLRREPLYNLAKVVEETSEVIRSLKQEPKENVVRELGDLIYFLEIAMVQHKIPWEEVENGKEATILQNYPSYQNEGDLYFELEEQSIALAKVFRRGENDLTTRSLARFFKLIDSIMERKGIFQEEVGKVLLSA